MEAMEEWGQADDRVIKRSYTSGVCISCAWFIYGIDAHCHTLLGCTLRQKQLQQGQHLNKKFKLWVPTLQKEMGRAPEAG